MEREQFSSLLEERASDVASIRDAAFSLHERVGQMYTAELPYSYHLQSVADNVFQFGHLVCATQEDVLPLVFGAYFHDSIEDARLTYNDVFKTARSLGMTEGQARTAAEIVYALTDEKGRTRAERQSEKYYDGIRETPYAPFVKMADRVANMRFSFLSEKGNPRMKAVYREEFPDFLWGISTVSQDCRFHIPKEFVDEVWSMIGEL